MDEEVWMRVVGVKLAGEGATLEGAPAHALGIWSERNLAKGQGQKAKARDSVPLPLPPPLPMPMESGVGAI